MHEGVSHPCLIHDLRGDFIRRGGCTGCLFPSDIPRKSPRIANVSPSIHLYRSDGPPSTPSLSRLSVVPLCFYFHLTGVLCLSFPLRFQRRSNGTFRRGYGNFICARLHRLARIARAPTCSSSVFRDNAISSPSYRTPVSTRNFDTFALFRERYLRSSNYETRLLRFTSVESRSRDRASNRRVTLLENGIEIRFGSGSDIFDRTRGWINARCSEEGTKEKFDSSLSILHAIHLGVLTIFALYSDSRYRLSRDSRNFLKSFLRRGATTFRSNTSTGKRDSCSAEELSRVLFDESSRTTREKFTFFLLFFIERKTSGSIHEPWCTIASRTLRRIARAN